MMDDKEDDELDVCAGPVSMERSYGKPVDIKNFKTGGCPGQKHDKPRK